MMLAVTVPSARTGCFAIAIGNGQLLPDHHDSAHGERLAW
jgi:hypothetical protein